jgi:hypothetical protein
MIRTIQPVTKLTTIISTQSQELWKREGLIQVILRQKFITELMTQTQAVKISRLTVILIQILITMTKILGKITRTI